MYIYIYICASSISNTKPVNNNNQGPLDRSTADPCSGVFCFLEGEGVVQG